MIIKIDLLSEQCENCPEFILRCKDKQVFNDSGQIEKVLTVSCKNERNCMRLEAERKRYSNG